MMMLKRLKMNKVLKLLLLLMLCQQSDAVGSDWRITTFCRDNFNRFTAVGATLCATFFTGPIGGAVTLCATHLWGKYSSTSVRLVSKQSDLLQVRKQIGDFQDLKGEIVSLKKDLGASLAIVTRAAETIREKVDRNSGDIAVCSSVQASLNSEVRMIDSRASLLQSTLDRIEKQSIAVWKRIKDSNKAQQEELNKLVSLARFFGKKSEIILAQQRQMEESVHRHNRLLNEACTNLGRLQAVGVDVIPRMRILEADIAEQLKIQREINTQLSNFGHGNQLKVGFAALRSTIKPAFLSVQEKV